MEFNNFKRYSKFLIIMLALGIAPDVHAKKVDETITPVSQKKNVKCHGHRDFIQSVKCHGHFSQPLPIWKRAIYSLVHSVTNIPGTIFGILDYSADHPYQTMLGCAGLYHVGLGPIGFGTISSLLGANFVWQKSLGHFSQPLPLWKRIIHSFIHDVTSIHRIKERCKLIKARFKLESTIYAAIKNTEASNRLNPPQGSITNINGIDYRVFRIKNAIKNVIEHHVFWAEDGIEYTYVCYGNARNECFGNTRNDFFMAREIKPLDRKNRILECDWGVVWMD